METLDSGGKFRPHILYERAIMHVQAAGQRSRSYVRVRVCAEGRGMILSARCLRVLPVQPLPT